MKLWSLWNSNNGNEEILEQQSYKLLRNRIYSTCRTESRLFATSDGRDDNSNNKKICLGEKVENFKGNKNENNASDDKLKYDNDCV